MKWIKYTVKTLSKAEDIVISALADAGVNGVEIEDKTPLTEEELQGMFVDIPPRPETDDGVAYLNFYLEPEDDRDAVLARVKEELDSLAEFMDIGEASITVSETEDKDWINNWKEYFHSFRVDDIFIVPSWEDDTPGPDDKIVLHIDPGTAFGTGVHETTQLCIRQLKKYVKEGCRLLDIGTGSGILGMVAIKLGAAHVVGTDLDPCTVEAVSQNKQENSIPEESFDLILGNIIDDKAVQDQCGEGYDIVTANILAEVLVPLAEEAVKHVRPGGIFITSGIIDDKEETVAAALTAAGFEILEITYQGEWVSITAVRP